MNDKETYLNALVNLMAGFPDRERARLMERFEEMIDDRVEMGMSEAEAVHALGDAEALIRDNAPGSALVPAEDAHSDWSDAIREIHLHVKNADMEIASEPLPENLSARITASDRNAFTWNLEDGMLTIQEAGEVRRGFFQRPRSVKLALNGFAPETLIADSYGGDIALAGLSVSLLTVLSTSSGDITLRDFRGADRTELTTRSGDICLRNATANGNCKVEAMSGDIELNRFYADALRLRVASGDVDAEVMNTRTAALGSASGDIVLSGLHVQEYLLCESGSGDIDLQAAFAPDIRLSSERGDITARLSPCPGGIEALAESKFGDTRVQAGAPSPNPSCRIRAVTISGDIDISALT